MKIVQKCSFSEKTESPWEEIERIPCCHEQNSYDTDKKLERFSGLSRYNNHDFFKEFHNFFIFFTVFIKF